MRKLLVSLMLSILALTAFISPSIAAKHSQTSSISINQTNVSIGDHITFTTTVEKLVGYEWPMVAVLCYQNDSLVYAELLSPDSTFLLGGGSSQWIENGGGPANCEADLDAYGFKSSGETIRTLATTTFNSN